MKVVLATQNPGKLAELLEMAQDKPWLELVLAPKELQVEESGNSFLDNALLKAKAAAKLTQLPAIADDSGLVVDYLNGQPGIHSARYCQGGDQAKRLKLLSELAGTISFQRTARFVCAMVVCQPDGQIAFQTTATWHGQISLVERGENGFGYDPIFLLPERNLTAAELRTDEKNQLSHRAQAWREVVNFLNTWQTKQ